ncbi:hypothetical protein J6590_003993 [Homalodisca vitripennis]|nr:hypothetical protein J6590_003993 [Homalodisca vitripennis]
MLNNNVLTRVDRDNVDLMMLPCSLCETLYHVGETCEGGQKPEIGPGSRNVLEALINLKLVEIGSPQGPEPERESPYIGKTRLSCDLANSVSHCKLTPYRDRKFESHEASRIRELPITWKQKGSDVKQSEGTRRPGNSGGLESSQKKISLVVWEIP